MRLALVIGRRHGEDSFSVLAPPALPHGVREFYHAQLLAEPSEFAELQMWTSDEGVTKSKHFAPPPETPAPGLEGPGAESAGAGDPAAPLGDAEPLPETEGDPTLTPPPSEEAAARKRR